MFDPKKLLDQFLGSQMPVAGGSVRSRADQAIQYAKDNPGKATALAGVLLGTKTGRNIGGTALKVGGLAAIAGLAYTAYQQYQQGQGGNQTAASNTAGAPTSAEPLLLPPPKDDSFHPSQLPQGEAAFALVLVRAMIAASRADGHIDTQERERIAGKLHESGIGGEAERFVNEELGRPVDMDTLISAAETEAQKVELYTASRLAIDPDTRAERGYLDLLAGRLQLPDALVDQIERTVDSVKEPAEPVPVGSAKSPW